MLTVSLTELDRTGPIRLRDEISGDDPLWSDWAGELISPVSVDVKVSATPTGQVVALGRFQARLGRECRRCLEPVEVSLDEELTLLWVPPDRRRGAPSDTDENEGVRQLDPVGDQLDLSPAIREEVVLAAPVFVTCRDDCRGLCPVCGINLNQETCDCDPDEPDPRWDALRALTED
ncbi:MAG: DUF177 domain-containing protein [Gemmatimonadales bacterium]|nr:MAG: DUF177 domain-containing protein [Gemmatimonadales bacterium]